MARERALLQRLAEWWSRQARAARWAAVVAAMAILWWSSSRPGNPLGEGAVASFLHNGAHVVAFGGLGALCLLALVDIARATPRQLGWSVAFAGAYGIVDELHQRTVPGRCCSVADVITDVTGASLVGCILLGWAAGHPRARRAAVALVPAALAAVAFATWGPW